MTNRSLVYVERSIDPTGQNRPTFLAYCDCGTATLVSVEVDASRLNPGQEGGTEAAFTCDTCQSSHWFRIKGRKQEEPL